MARGLRIMWHRLSFLVKIWRFSFMAWLYQREVDPREMVRMRGLLRELAFDLSVELIRKNGIEEDSPPYLWEIASSNRSNFDHYLECFLGQSYEAISHEEDTLPGV